MKDGFPSINKEKRRLAISQGLNSALLGKHSNNTNISFSQMFLSGAMLSLNGSNLTSAILGRNSSRSANGSNIYWYAGENIFDRILENYGLVYFLVIIGTVSLAIALATIGTVFFFSFMFGCHQSPSEERDNQSESSSSDEESQSECDTDTENMLSEKPSNASIMPTHVTFLRENAIYVSKYEYTKGYKSGGDSNRQCARLEVLADDSNYSKNLRETLNFGSSSIVGMCENINKISTKIDQSQPQGTGDGKHEDLLHSKHDTDLSNVPQDINAALSDFRNKSLDALDFNIANLQATM